MSEQTYGTSLDRCVVCGETLEDCYLVKCDHGKLMHEDDCGTEDRPETVCECGEPLNVGEKPLLDCPECETPVLPATHYSREYGWRWEAGTPAKCPELSCGVNLVVDVTDDYEEDCLASLEVVRRD